MTKCHFVVDTGYLLELFKVDGHSNENKYPHIEKKFKYAAEQRFPVYIPVLVLFELVNHIAHINDGSRRKQLADKLAVRIKSCVEKQNPWIITPSEELASVQQLVETLEQFSNVYSIDGMGLTDTSVLLEAQRLSKKYKSFGHKVHIWTTERSLKAREPDNEENPYPVS